MTSHISDTTSRYLRPVLATSDGLVVMPSMIPCAAASRTSATSPVSMKNFMGLSLQDALVDGASAALVGGGRLERAAALDRDVGGRAAGTLDARAAAQPQLERGDGVLEPVETLPRRGGLGGEPLELHCQRGQLGPRHAWSIWIRPRRVNGCDAPCVRGGPRGDQ